MRYKNWIKVIVCILIFSSFYILPLDRTKAASQSEATIMTTTYKEDFMKYPQISNLKSITAQTKINEVLARHIKLSYSGYQKLIKEMEEFKKKGKCKENPQACKYSYITSYEVKHNENGKLSILLFDSTYSGGAHGLTTVTTYNFNLKTGLRYKIKDILSTDRKLELATEYAKQYMKQHSDTFFADEDKLTDFTINQDTQFYFTNNGIELIFQQYEVAPYAAGHPTINVPSSIYQ